VRRSLGGVTVLVMFAVLATACGGSGSQRLPDVRFGAGKHPGPRSIVQLGDSIASGEGTLYGYTWDNTKKDWVGGDVNAKWPDPYPDCHHSQYAYGETVAKNFDASFKQFACTGAAFANGITTPMVVSGKTRRPAEFGDWAQKTNINAEYDAAKPDLVLVTLGADDVVFSDIVENCIKNAYKHYWAPKTYPLECVDENPGDTINKDFFGFLPTLKKNYVTLVSWIQDRANTNHVPVPKVVFTTYANPFPKSGTKCDDVNNLYPEQMDYLTSLLQDMNRLIKTTVVNATKKKPGVAVADIEKVYQEENADHRWCSSDPWAYGLSIYRVSDPSSFNSLAPFHPTIDGQKAIAEAIEPSVVLLFDTEFPIDATSTTTAPS